MAYIIDGKALAQEVKSGVAAEVGRLRAQNIPVGLAVVIVGDDPASRVYVNNKKKSCAAVGIESFEFAMPASATTGELVALVRELNERPDVSGILVQQPLPKQISVETVNAAIDPMKDVDAFHPMNIGRVMTGDCPLLPCTPAGIMEMLRSIRCDLTGKECVVVGRSCIVGKPMALLLLQANATVTICHSRTKNLAEVCRRADVLVAAVGKRALITADMVKPGAVVIDVGMNRSETGKLCGDVDFPAVSEAASAITPVPGGVGPMTIAMLMRNTLTAAKLQHGLR